MRGNLTDEIELLRAWVRNWRLNAAESILPSTEGLDDADRALDVVAKCVERADDDAREMKKYVAHLTDALVLANMSLKQGKAIDAHIAANGPTIGQIIATAMMAAPRCVGELR